MSTGDRASVQVELLGKEILAAAEGARIGLSVTFVDVQAPRVCFINDAGAEILGYAKEEIYALPAMDLITPEEQEQAVRRREQRRSGAPVPNWYETTIRRKSGAVVHIQVGLSTITLERRPAVVAFFIDATERWRAQAALARSEQQFRQLVELAPEAVWISKENRLAYVNPAAVRMLGYPAAEALLAKTPLDLVHEEHHAALLERSREMIAAGTSLPPREYRTWRFDGRAIIVEVQSMPVDWQGQTALLSFGRDVSARKEMEMRLVQADRLAALGTLMAGIAHEINNPLTYVQLAVEQAQAAVRTAEASPALRDKLQVLLQDIGAGAGRVADIVRDLRGFTRAGVDARSAVQLADVINGAVRFAANEIRHRAKLELDLAAAPPVLANAERLEQVVLNLLVNAAQAMPENRPDNRIVVRLFPSRGGVIAQVSDNGSGISPADRSRIFDPFFTTKPQGVGTGLGLFICHGIVTGHAGTLDVESEVGKGTTFSMWLPAAAGVEPAATAAPSLTPPAARSTWRVLIVDDEPSLGPAVSRMLEPFYDSEAVRDGETALARLESGRFDLVLCDLMMPGMTGMELFAEAVRRHPALESRFVFMTGGAFTSRAADFLARTRLPVLEKPFSSAALLAALTRV